MLNKIIDFSVRNKLIVGILTIALILYGTFELTRLPIDAVPDITNNQVQVITTAPSYGATDIERLVTFPVEQANSNIAGLKEIRSYSRFGLSLVTIVFDDDTDIYWARQQVAERLQQISSEIPTEIGTPQMGPISTGLGEIYQYVVRPKEGYEHRYSIEDLRTIQDWIIRRQLLGVKGVAEVSSFGGKLKQYEVAVQPQKLQSYGVNINDVFNSLSANNQNSGGAYIEKNSGVLYIRSEGLLQSIDDIGNISIKGTASNTPLMIKDVAEVRIGHATRYGALTYNETGEVSGAIVMMLKGGNSNVVIAGIKKRIEEIQKSLPEGVVIEPFLDRTKMVNNAISTVETNLLEGALIVVFVLVLFLGNLRAGLLVASVIPLSMLFAIIMMNLFGVSGNLMSLGALDFGLIVDGAVIIVEAVMHQLSHRGAVSGIISREKMDHQVKTAASRMMNSAVFGQIIILIVYLPIFTLEGIEGKMFKPMAQTVAFALLGAFILSLTYVPMVSSLLLSRKPGPGENMSDRIMASLSKAYERRLGQALRFPRTVLALTIGLFVIALTVLSGMGGEFIPSIEEGDYAVETRVLPGSSLNTTIENTQKVVKILKSRFPEVQKIVTKIGSSEVPTEPLPMDMGDMIITLKDKKEWTSAKTFDELSEKMAAAASEVPGVTTSFQFPVQMRFNELMTGARQDVVCKIFGEDLDTLAAYAKKLGKMVSQVEGTADLYIEAISGLPQIVIEYNRAALAQYGLSVEEVNKVVNTAFAGQSSGMVFEGEKRFDLVVRLQGQNRQNLEDVRDLLVPVRGNQQVPLYQVATVGLKNSPNQIQRDDAKRRVLVGFNVKDRDVESIVEELRKEVDRNIKLPAGYIVSYGGAFENLNAAKSRLMVAVPVSLALIFLLLYFAFQSVRQSLLIYSAIPLSAIGGILLLAMRGMPFSISAGVGFIALFGIAVLNGIVLVAEFNRIEASGETDPSRTVIKGSVNRLRPVLMTAFVASLGFLPMALSTGAGGDVQRPLATVVIGGLLIATFLTLFVLPVLYIQFGGARKPALSKQLTATAILLILGTFPGMSQTRISLQEATDRALQNNLTMKNAALSASYRKQLIGSAATIPATQFSTELGKFNSPYNDSRYSISQSSSLPSVYNRQKEVFKSEWQENELNSKHREAEIKREVARVYYQLKYLLSREELMKRNDSLYSEFLRVANLRLKAGETNVLEQAGASAQRGSIQLQLNQVHADQQLLQRYFSTLLNTTDNLIPEDGSLQKPIAAEPADTIDSAHPLLELARQREQTQAAATRLEQAKLLPEIGLTYSNMSLSDGISLDRSDRFGSMQATLSIPLFTRAQRTKIKASQIAEEIAKNDYAQQLQSIAQKKHETLTTYRKLSADLRYYQETGLPDAENITNALKSRLSAGEINYLEWVTLLQQSHQILEGYLQTLHLLNNSIIELEYLDKK